MSSMFVSRAPKYRNRFSRRLHLHGDQAGLELGLTHELEAHRRGKIGKNSHPSSQSDWMDDQPVFVDRPCADQGLSEPHSAVCQQIPTGFLFQSGNLLGEIAGKDPRIGPVCILQRSEEHTSELQSPCNLVCRLLLEKKKKNKYS